MSGFSSFFFQVPHIQKICTSLCAARIIMRCYKIARSLYYNDASDVEPGRMKKVSAKKCVKVVVPCETYLESIDEMMAN